MGIVVIAAMVVIFITGFTMDWGAGLTAVATLFGPLVVVFALAPFLAPFIAKKESEKIQAIDFSSGAGAPTLKKRCDISAKAFKIKPLYNHDFDYHPTTVTYTSVTVGGVTTGGFDVNKEHYTSRTTGRSGKYALFSVAENYKIWRIILDESLLESARNNPFIKNFLRGNELVLEHNNEKTKLSAGATANLVDSIKSGNVIMQNALTQDVINESELTKEECEKLLAWIGGE